MSAVASLPLKALIVEDEKNIRTTLSVCLEGFGCRVAAVASPDAALSVTAQECFDLAFVDLRLGSGSGLDLLPSLIENNPNIAVVIITAYATIDTAVEAIKRGAAEYLPKPFSPAHIRHVVDKVTERLAARSGLLSLQSALSESVADMEIESSAPKMRAALEQLWRTAESDVAVLLRGESGTGKTVFAQALHQRSSRASRPFVTVNVATLTDELLMGELFGHVRGSFTGAVRDQIGRVELANGGTLFLDEIGDLSPTAQARILRFLQDRKFERLGEAKTRYADVRLLAATNRDLETMVKAGQFREDLFYRLSVVEVGIPPLRERREDIVPLARHFLAFFDRTMRRPPSTMSEQTSQMLAHYAWPGNVRELRNTIERALVFSKAQILAPEAFPERMRFASSKRPELGGAFSLDEIEREHIMRLLATSDTQEEVARTLGIDVATLWRKRKRFENA